MVGAGEVASGRYRPQSAGGLNGVHSVDVRKIGFTFAASEGVYVGDHRPLRSDAESSTTSATRSPSSIRSATRDAWSNNGRVCRSRRAIKAGPVPRPRVPCGWRVTSFSSARNPRTRHGHSSRENSTVGVGLLVANLPRTILSQPDAARGALDRIVTGWNRRTPSNTGSGTVGRCVRPASGGLRTNAN